MLTIVLEELYTNIKSLVRMHIVNNSLFSFRSDQHMPVVYTGVACVALDSMLTCNFTF